MKRVLIAAAIVGSTLTGCIGETNDETLRAFDSGKLINCKKGFLRSDNIITNENYTYSTEHMLFISNSTNKQAFNMNACYSRK